MEAQTTYPYFIFSLIYLIAYPGWDGLGLPWTSHVLGVVEGTQSDR